MTSIRPATSRGRKTPGGDTGDVLHARIPQFRSAERLLTITFRNGRELTRKQQMLQARKMGMAGGYRSRNAEGRSEAESSSAATSIQADQVNQDAGESNCFMNAPGKTNLSG
jgi:hypothetical protein